MLTRIDHVGIACRDLGERIAFYSATFGLTVASVEVNEEQGVREAMLRLTDEPDPGPAAASYIQLLQPTRLDSPVGKFLGRRGEGIHHVGYRVADISAVLETIRAEGLRLIDERPRHGSMGTSIAFVHPSDMGGVLTELVQPPPDG